MVSLPIDFIVNDTSLLPVGIVTDLGYSKDASWSLLRFTVRDSAVEVLRLTVTVISLPSLRTEVVVLKVRVGPSLSYTVTGTETTPPEEALLALQLHDAIQTAAEILTVRSPSTVALSIGPRFTVTSSTPFSRVIVCLP